MPTQPRIPRSTRLYSHRCITKLVFMPVQFYAQAFSRVRCLVGFYTNSTENFTYQRSRKYVVRSVFTLTELNEPVLTGITLYERTSAYQQCYASISTGSAAPVDVRAVIATVGRRWWLKESLNHCGGGPLM